MEEMKNGIDVSYAQGAVDWSKVKASGKVDFAIIRSGYVEAGGRYHTDKWFEANWKGCKAVGLPFGIYHYSYARTVAAAKQEARLFLERIQGSKPEYPVAFDFEEPAQLALPLSTQMEIIEAFLDTVEKAGYYGILYMSGSPMKRLLNAYPQRMTRFDRWVAHYGADTPMVRGGMWQYSASGTVPGIQGHVDLNHAYKDYPAIIKAAGLNGFSTEGEETPEDTVTQEAYNKLLEQNQKLGEENIKLVSRNREVWAQYDRLAERLKALVMEL